MNTIIQQVTDPAWWFTAVVIGLIVSVIAGYAKDYISLLASNLSKSYKIRRARDIELKRAKIDFYSNDQGLLTLAYTRAAISALFAFAAMGITLLLPVFHVSVKSKPDLDSILNGPLSMSTTTFGVLSWIFFAITMNAYWRMMQSLLFAKEVHSSFKEKSYPKALK